MAIWSTVALSTSFLVANLIQNRNVASGIANVASLGISFISGAFVPQELLVPSVLFMASFTPTYWFIKANNDIFALTRFNWASLSEVFVSMGIQLAFAVAICRNAGLCEA